MRAVLRVPRRALLPPSFRNTPSFIIDRPREFPGGRGPLRALASHSRRWPPNLSRAPGLSEEPVASLRRFPLTFLGDRWRGDIDFGSASSCRGPAADEPSPCEVRKWRHWKKSGQCQASAHSSDGTEEEPDFSREQESPQCAITVCPRSRPVLPSLRTSW